MERRWFPVSMILCHNRNKPIYGSIACWFAQSRSKPYGTPEPREHPPAFRIALMDMTSEGYKAEHEIDWRYTRCEQFLMRWAHDNRLAIDEIADLLNRSETEALLIWLDMRERGEFETRSGRGRPKKEVSR